MLENFFHLKENKTDVKTELMAGLTTFMTMAYIIALNPNLIVGFAQGAFGGFGDDGFAAWNGVFMATCLASAVAMFCMAFLANKPFALATRYCPYSVFISGSASLSSWALSMNPRR